MERLLATPLLSPRTWFLAILPSWHRLPSILRCVRPAGMRALCTDDSKQNGIIFSLRGTHTVELLYGARGCSTTVATM